MTPLGPHGYNLSKQTIQLRANGDRNRRKVIQGCTIAHSLSPYASLLTISKLDQCQYHICDHSVVVEVAVSNMLCKLQERRVLQSFEPRDLRRVQGNLQDLR
jgi:hypothetical protein